MLGHIYEPSHLVICSICFVEYSLLSMGFLGGSEVKTSAFNVGNLGSIPGSGRSPGGREDPLEKEMATHSSILAWKIPLMEELGRLQSTGSQSRTRLSNFTSIFKQTIVRTIRKAK